MCTSSSIVYKHTHTHKYIHVMKFPKRIKPFHLLWLHGFGFPYNLSLYLGIDLPASQV